MAGRYCQSKGNDAREKGEKYTRKQRDTAVRHLVARFERMKKTFYVA